ncbi:hypothetical protein [Microbacterium gorillae]|uniref:endonuclease toxin domain-containing protein n=1 Tax=Microbacterium gorillae TaxID=1231063 RepID=UPI003D99FEF3
MQLSVDPTAYASASQTFGEFLAGDIAAVQKALNEGLAATTMCAGNDPAGMTFGDAYDLAAGELVQSLDDLRRGSITVAALLQQSGFNHARSDAASTISGGEVLSEDEQTYDPGLGQCVVPPSIAGGAMGDPPEGWEIVAAAAGMVWPDGDTGKLRAIGAAWRGAAQGLNATLPLISTGLTALASQQSPELDDARTICISLGNVVTAIADQAIVLAEAAESHADEIDQAHSDMIGALNEFLIATLAIEAAAAAAGALTAGAGAVAMQLAEAAAIARTAERISLILARVLAAVSLTGGRMVWQSLDVVGDGLKAILARTPKIAETVPVSGALKAMDDLANKLSSSPWPLGPGPRGLEIEWWHGGNLPPGFPTIDRFIDGLAISMKTIDLTAPTYRSASGIRSVLRGYIRKLAAFKGGSLSGRTIDELEIEGRMLYVVVPRKSLMSPEQQAALAEMAAYARELGIEWRLEFQR